MERRETSRVFESGDWTVTLHYCERGSRPALRSLVLVGPPGSCVIGASAPPLPDDCDPDAARAADPDWVLVGGVWLSRTMGRRLAGLRDLLVAAGVEAGFGELLR